MKSDVDLSTKRGRAKLAKFVLGAANRESAGAARRFDGHALLILGIRDGELHGIAPFEAHELEREVRKYTGDPGPEWDFEQLATAEGRSVVVIIAPCAPAGQPWICRCDFGEEKMRNGDIFLRADGETRPARAAEVDGMLQRRAAAAHRDVDLELGVVGVVRSYRFDTEVVEHYIDAMRSGLLGALPEPEYDGGTVTPPALRAIAAATEGARHGWFPSTPENRTPAQYRAAVDAWCDNVRAAMPAFLDAFAGHTWRGVAVRVLSRTGYLARPEFQLHIAGEVEALTKEWSAPTVDGDLPPLPRTWGPRTEMPGLLGMHFTPPEMVPMAFNDVGRVTFDNTGSVSLQFELRELRPGREHLTEDDEFVLIFRGADPPASLSGTWTATVEGDDRVYDGSFTVAVDTEIVDLSEWLAAALTGPGEGPP